MIYLTLSADYMSASLMEAGQKSLDADDLGFPARFKESLNNWNDRYQPIIQMDTKDRLRPGPRLEIDELDRMGLALAQELSTYLPAGSKVSYFSEGLLTKRDDMS